MKLSTLLLLSLFILLGRVATAQTIVFEYKEVPYVDPGPSFLQIGMDFWSMPLKIQNITTQSPSNPDGVTVYDRDVSGQTRFHLLFTGANPEMNFQLEYGFGGGQINLKNKNFYLGSEKSKYGFFDFYFGLRYFPAKPTTGLGKLTMRFTAAALLGGQYLNGEVGFDPDINAGILFAAKDKATGLILGVDYHPVEQEFQFDVNTGIISWEKYLVTIGTAPAFKATLFFGL